MQLIGKLMRSADVELARAARRRAPARPRPRLARAAPGRALARRADRRRRGDDALRQRHAGADLQRLRALVRNARKDAAAAPEKRSGRAYRELFQFIREREADA